jgi:D-amino-acid dehydrogenase
MKFDVVVAGAGIIGVCIAIHLQKRGNAVLLIDRGEPGGGTSYGNSGLIERQAVVPYAFPREIGRLLAYARNRSVDVHYHPLALPQLAPFLFGYWRHSSERRLEIIAQAYERLIARSVSEHDELIAASGASPLIRRDGWLKVFHSKALQEEQHQHAEQLHREHGLKYRALGRAELAQLEPSLSPKLAGGIHWLQPLSTVDPGALVAAYAAHFKNLGGVFRQSDARTLEPAEGAWTIGDYSAGQAVIALGPWADTVTRRLGYRLPLGVKRGYHMHYASTNGARLNHPVYDVDGGYMLAPMAKGIRLTTGAEFARRDDPPTPVQIDRAEVLARDLFPLASRIEPQPWMGSRPCTPDMLPIIGAAPRHKNLWFAFGHSHHGLTLAGITGRLISEMMSGRETVVDPTPYRVDRF